MTESHCVFAASPKQGQAGQSITLTYIKPDMFTSLQIELKNINVFELVRSTIAELTSIKNYTKENSIKDENESVIDYINRILDRDILSGEPISSDELNKISKALKDIKVEVSHLSFPRRYIIENITKLAAKNTKFNYQNKQITVEEYFRNTRDKSLKYPFLPCLKMKAFNDQTYIPLEFCQILGGQSKRGTSSPSFETNIAMLKAMLSDANENLQSIKYASEDIIEQINSLISVKFPFVKGRLLEPPTIEYRDNIYSIPDEDGVWKIDGRKVFKSCAEVEAWTIIDFAQCSDEKVDKFIRAFISTSNSLGLNFNETPKIQRYDKNIAFEKAVDETKERKAAFAIIILSKGDSYHNYNEIKFIADYEKLLVTQCVYEEVLNRFNTKIAATLCLNINAKLGGVNHILRQTSKVFSEGVMVIGADTIHSETESSHLSFAAAVSSMDAYLSNYKLSCRVKKFPGRKISQELILEIKEMFHTLLKSFYDNRGMYPEKILFFRSGVSKGQFKQVHQFEIREIQQACIEETGSIIPMTFLLVQKCHNITLRPKNLNHHQNIPAGTVIDTDVVNSNYFEFLLNSHGGSQGINISTKYAVLKDDNNFNADELQEISYHLCYTYNKCCNSISLPAPVKYADLACYRAKRYANFFLQKKQEDSSAPSNSLLDYIKTVINTMGDRGTFPYI